MVIVKYCIFYGSFLLFLLLVFLIWKYKRSEKKFICGFGIILSLLLIYCRFIEPNIINVKAYNVDLIKNKEIKIAVFADTHTGIYSSAKLLQRVVNKTNQQNPDLILIPGDFVYHLKSEKLSENLKPLKDLKAPTFAVLGNHDNGFPGQNVAQELITVLNNFNIKVLENASQEINIKGESFKIDGLPDLWKELPKQPLQNDSDKFNILLAHNPDTSYYINHSGTDLIVSGHTHGGQIRIPWLFKKAIPSEYGFDKGWYDINNIKIFVNPGIGTVLLPCRFLMVPEISILNI